MLDWPDDDPLENGILTEEVHANLIKKRTARALEAGIPEKYFWCPDDRLPKADLQWVKDFRKHRSAGAVGLAYIGEQFEPGLEHRFCALAGKLMRNFINAKVGLLDQIFANVRYDGYPDVTCLLLPTFCEVQSDQVRGFSAASLLMSRFAMGKGQTVVAAPSWPVIKSTHGLTVHDHIKQNFAVITGVSS
jgi:hypothetical protein